MATETAVIEAGPSGEGCWGVRAKQASSGRHLSWLRYTMTENDARMLADVLNNIVAHWPQHGYGDPATKAMETAKATETAKAEAAKYKERYEHLKSDVKWALSHAEELVL